MMILVWCTTTFEGFHCWPDAPEAVDFLRVRHRHRFHVKAWKRVSDSDREIEFILLQRAVTEEIAIMQEDLSTETWSCERWAIELIKSLGLHSCEVSEDGENGAIVFDSGADDRSAAVSSALRPQGVTVT